MINIKIYLKPYPAKLLGPAGGRIFPEFVSYLRGRRGVLCVGNGLHDMQTMII